MLRYTLSSTYILHRRMCRAYCLCICTYTTDVCLRFLDASVNIGNRTCRAPPLCAIVVSVVCKRTYAPHRTHNHPSINAQANAEHILASGARRTRRLPPGGRALTRSTLPLSQAMAPPSWLTHLQRVVAIAHVFLLYTLMQSFKVIQPKTYYTV